MPPAATASVCGAAGTEQGPGVGVGVGVGAGVFEMVTVISFDAALDPMPFAARTRTKYVPAPTPLAEKLVEVLPVLRVVRSERPVAETASIT